MKVRAKQPRCREQQGLSDCMLETGKGEGGDSDQPSGVVYFQDTLPFDHSSRALDRYKGNERNTGQSLVSEVDITAKSGQRGEHWWVLGQ